MSSSFFGRDHAPCGEQYRTTTLGNTLISALDEMIQSGKMTNKLACKILIHFDVAINAHLGRCASRVIFRAVSIKKYKEFQKVYTVVFKDFEVCGRGRAHPLQIEGLEQVMVIAHPSANQQKKKTVVQPVVATPSDDEEEEEEQQPIPTRSSRSATDKDKEKVKPPKSSRKNKK